MLLSDSIDGLSRHMKSSLLAVGFRQAPDLSLLQALKGVQSVQADGERRVQVFCDPNTDPTDQIVKLAAEKEWGLVEISPQGVSLEQLFLELTKDEQKAAAPGESRR